MSGYGDVSGDDVDAYATGGIFDFDVFRTILSKPTRYYSNVKDAFWLLVRTLDHYIPDFFNPSLTQLRIDAAVFEFLLHRTNKRLARHLVSFCSMPFGLRRGGN